MESSILIRFIDEPAGNVKLGAAKSVEEFRARTLVEKKTVLNLLEGYAYVNLQ
jgi:hypothetical protein